VEDLMGRIERVAVVGAGTMGGGIALWLAKAGLQVRMRDTSREVLDRARQAQESTLKAMAAAGAVNETGAPAILGRIHPTTRLAEAVGDAEFVLEAAPEVLDLKRALFAEMEAAAPPGIPLASNTSGISITRLAAGARDPARVVGMHWWNPPHVVRVIEIVRGDGTGEAAFRATRELVVAIGKKPVVCQKDVPGFLGNRILYALLREALHCYEQGIGTAEDIDTMVREAFALKLAFMGPMALLDLAGLDVYHNVAQYLNADLCSGGEVSRTVARLVAQGALGLKTCKGFYEYSRAGIPDLARQRGQQMAGLLKLMGA
jgi:3-hydroxybutyryl-CoA dehydrogenase/5-formyl-3-hydroxy-2-methylpyridine 4-carboxylate dehydrogenase